MRVSFCRCNSRLQEEFIQAQNEIKHLLCDKQSLQDKMNLQMVEFQKSLLAKTKEVEEIRQQVSQAQRRDISASLLIWCCSSEQSWTDIYVV